VAVACPVFGSQQWSLVLAVAVGSATCALQCMVYY
ncbi:uncharacterized protein METZ01_LOCUS161652, partial [marine metagenome]